MGIDDILALGEKSIMVLPLRAVSKQLIGLGLIKKNYSYATIVDDENSEILQECWGDGERVYFEFLYPQDAKYIVAVCNVFPQLAAEYKRAMEVVEAAKELTRGNNRWDVDYKDWHKVQQALAGLERGGE